MTNDYYNSTAMSASAIKQGARSMRAMRDFIEGDRKPPTPAMQFGTLAHRLILQPGTIHNMAVIDGTRATKAYKEAELSYGTDNVTTLADFDKAVAMRDALMTHDIAESVIGSMTATEQAFAWLEGPYDCKALVDGITEKCFVEYKTTATLDNFAATAARMHYHLQLGWYHRATGKDAAYVVAQETAAPYEVAVFRVGKVSLKQWYGAALDIAARYWAEDIAPAYPDLMELELPPWATHTGDCDSLDLEDYGI